MNANIKALVHTCIPFNIRKHYGFLSFLKLDVAHQCTLERNPLAINGLTSATSFPRVSGR